MKKIILTLVFTMVCGGAFADSQTYGSDSRGNTWSSQTFDGQSGWSTPANDSL